MTMIRVFDVLFSLLGLILLLPLILVIYLIGYFDTGSPIFRQLRIGKNQKMFPLYKFRSMKLTTESVATHLVNPNSITKFGAFLRKSKLDELPQLFNVLVGHMSLVGPRPNLPNQEVLLIERSNAKVYSVRPGITGLAQIKKIDMSTPKLLAQTDQQMIANLNILTYFKYIFVTLTGKGFGDRVNSK